MHYGINSLWTTFSINTGLKEWLYNSRENSRLVWVICCCCSVSKSCLILCNPMNSKMPGFPVLQYLCEFAETHAYWSSDAIQPSHSLLSLLLLPSTFPNIRVFSNESTLCIRWPKYWSFSFSTSPSNEYSRLIFFKNDWFEILVVQGTLESLPTPQYKSINSLALSLLNGPTLMSIHDYWKNHSLD